MMILKITYQYKISANYFKSHMFRVQFRFLFAEGTLYEEYYFNNI